MDTSSLPLADAGREEDARELFNLSISPDEYAARHAHQWDCFSFDDYRYSDEELTRWIQRLGDILFGRNSAPTIEELRAKHLTPQERQVLEAEIGDRGKTDI